MIKNFRKIFALILTLIFSANYYAQCTGCTVVQNVACSDNGTPGTSTDDFVSFEVSTTFFSDYSITATFAGSSVPITLMDGTTSATNLMGGVVQHFKIMNGALGTGNFTLTITPVTGTPETLTFANPGTCSTVCTSASTGNTVSYVYDSPYVRGDIQGVAFSLPKFDEGTNRKLTKVTVECGSRVYGSALLENRGSDIKEGKYRIQEKYYGDIAFLGFTYSNAGDIILQSPGYPALATIPAAVNVPAQGSWPGDATYAFGTGTAMSTMSRMQIFPDNKWLDNYQSRGVNPNTSPNWVTNITGNASHDDDIVFLPIQPNAYIQPALTYTLQADLNKFIGTGAFNGTYDATTSMSSTGSINLSMAMINNLYAKVTYTYDCIAPPAIDAIDGSQTVSSGTTGTSVLANDTIENGAAGSVTLGATGNATISQTNTTNAGVNIDTATGNVVVSPGTPAGTYTITYEICTKATPVTCDTAQETVTVPNLLDAVNDNYGPVTADTTIVISVIANDKNIAGTAAVIGSGAGQVSITTSTDAAGTAGAWPTGFTLKPDGTISVANGTAAGTYTLYYTICNQTAGSPCDTATVTLTVIPTVQADDDAFAATATQGISGATLGNVLTNDNYKSVADGSATTSYVNISVTTLATPAYAGAPVPSINTATGAVTLPPNTPAGSYTITYQICDKSGSPCDPATVTVTVAAPTIDAVNGTQSVSAGTTGTTSVLANDTYNGGAAGSATLANVNLTQTATTIAGVTLNTTTGMITVTAGTPAGSYVVTYQICDKVNTGVCDIATETVNVAAPAIDAVTETTPAINGINGGTTASLLANDTLNGAPVTVGATGNVTLTPVTVPAGLTLNADGTVTVASGTPAGNYNVTYQICDKVNPTNCDTVTSIVVVSAPAIDAVNGTQAVSAGTTGTTSVLANDTYNGGAAGSATLANVNLTQTATTNAGVTLNTTTGMITVAAGTPAGTYVVTYQICDKVNTGVCDTATETVTVSNLLDSDGDSIPDINDLDDDNDGILDTTEGQCINTSNPSTDGFDSPLVTTVNGNNIQSVNPYNGWGAETGVANAFNVIRVNGAGYASGPDNAQSGTQYIDINASSTYVYKNITLTTPTIVSASAWFANRESSIGGYAPWSTKIEIRNETTGITVAQGNTINFTSSISDEIWNNSSINSVALPAGTYRIRMFVGDFGHLDSISYCFSKDTDGDGTPDHLDLDSDNDGCPDAVEGGDNITQTMLNGSNAIGSNISGTLNSPAIATVDANGVPVITNTGSTFNVDGQAQGQTVGSSANASVNGCYCYKPAQTSGTILDTNHGITALGRAGADNSNWPMVRKGAWTVLEAKTKGFVVNRLTDAQITDIPSADLREGMMVYNITQDCLQINIDGTATGWRCFNTQTCPDL